MQYGLNNELGTANRLSTGKSSSYNNKNFIKYLLREVKKIK